MTAITQHRVGSASGAPLGNRPPVVPSRVVHHPRARPTRGPVRCAEASPRTLHGSRLTPRGRLVVAGVWVLLVVVGALLVGRPSNVDSALSRDSVPTTTVHIQPGDTLWEIASAAQPSADPRDVIEGILVLNELGSVSDVQPGDTLIVPTAG